MIVGITRHYYYIEILSIGLTKIISCCHILSSLYDRWSVIVFNLFFPLISYNVWPSLRTPQSRWAPFELESRVNSKWPAREKFRGCDIRREQT